MNRNTALLRRKPRAGGIIAEAKRARLVDVLLMRVGAPRERGAAQVGSVLALDRRRS